MRCLEHRVAFVLRIATPVVVQRANLEADVRANAMLVSRKLLFRVLVDVVPEVRDEVELFGRHVPVGRKVSKLVVLAGCDAEAKGRRGAARRRSAQATDGTGRVTDREAIEVPPVGGE